MLSMSFGLAGVAGALKVTPAEVGHRVGALLEQQCGLVEYPAALVRCHAVGAECRVRRRHRAAHLVAVRHVQLAARQQAVLVDHRLALGAIGPRTRDQQTGRGQLAGGLGTHAVNSNVTSALRRLRPAR